MKRILAVLAAATVLAVVPLAAADANFSDVSGDGGGGPDVVRVDVANDAQNRVAVSVELAGSRPLASDSDVVITFDTDQNADTGSGGWDYYAIVAGDGSHLLRLWDGTQWVDAPATTVKAYVFDGLVLFGIDRAQLGNTAAFDFAVDAAKTANDEIVARDFAPDGEGSFWSYATVAKTYGIVGTPIAAKPKVPGASAKLLLSFMTLRTDSIEPLVGGKSTCKVTVGGKRVTTRLASGLGFAQCATSRRPKTAKGKLLRATMTTSAGGKVVTKTFSAKVR
jgi:hypothetical protein